MKPPTSLSGTKKNLRLIWVVIVTSTVYNHNYIFRDVNNNL